MEFELPKHERSIIKVIGVGGGGSNAVTHMYKQGIVGVDFAICNTDNQALELSPVPTKIQLGPSLTEGRGAGSKPEVGKNACIESIDDITAFLQDNTKMLFVTAGMGGGTGTGAGPIIAQLAREMGILTVGIVTLPFTFEGRRRGGHAIEGLEEMRDSVDALIIISNDKLREMHGNLALSDAFSQADDVLTTAAKGIAEIITVPGYVNVDFEDVNTVMRNSGVAIMGTALAEGTDRARKAVEVALNSSLLKDNDIKGAKYILLNITSGNKEVTMDEIGQITEYVQDAAGHGTDLIWGNCTDETLGDKISVTIIATGFESKMLFETDLENKVVEMNTPAPEIKISPVEVSSPMIENVIKEVIAIAAKENVELENKKIESVNKTPFDIRVTESESNRSHGFDAKDQPGIEKYTSTQNPHEEPFASNPKQDRLSAFREQKERERREYLRQLSNKLNNPQSILDLEREPAYLRKKVVLEEVVDSADQKISRMSYNPEEDQPFRSNGNQYLHDNAD